MRCACVLGLVGSLMLAWWSADAALAQTGNLRIEWEVKNRFRLFRSENDFERHVAAYRADGVLGAERRLAIASDGRGWAQDIVERLCVDGTGKLMQVCNRDGVRESYLAPRDHRIAALLSGPLPAGLFCQWTFEDGETEPRHSTIPCDEEIDERVLYGKATIAKVDIAMPDGTIRRLAAEIAVRDVLIAGMGDSVGAGEGNPDRAVRLSDIGFCFRRLLAGSSSEYYRPGRDGFTGDKSCADMSSGDSGASDWRRHAARWESAPCHRSLYSYQTRAALAIAIENPHLAVTFIPLACSGATIATGFLGPQNIRECPSPDTNSPCPAGVNAQIAALSEALANGHRAGIERPIDLVLLTIGANDVRFSALVGNVIIEAATERLLATRGGNTASVADAQKALDQRLPADFARLRAALKPLVGGNLARVVFVSYGHPALASPDTPCPGGRDGFDIHPAFTANGARLREVAAFVSQRFLPRLKALALCEGTACRDPMNERMTFVDAHQAAFAHHGFCARSEEDPEFDRECFSPKGESFNANLALAATQPMACGRPGSEYRPYLPRQRWVRTANDSYFTAMSYPQGVLAASIHDAMWGILSAVQGGAVHPTAEGYAAMADAALPAMREALDIAQPGAPVSAKPLPPPGQTRAEP
ncbi:MAG TPA: hypothetical protein VH684_17805 [Xanthobacteraceae bacterium]|jgi:hypothetical protein